MSTDTESAYFLLESLREHVLSPIATAEQRVATERTKVTAERRAYHQFYDRISGIETVTTTRLPTTPTPRTYAESRPRAVERVRTAFRATVMMVDHYDDVYDESLNEHVSAELSPDVAALFETISTAREEVSDLAATLPELRSDLESVTESGDAEESDGT